MPPARRSAAFRAAAALVAAMGWPCVQAAGQGIGASDQPPEAPSQSPELDPYEGRPVRRIVLKQADDARPGDPAITPEIEQLVRNQVRVREGTPFSRAQVTTDVRNLTRLARFSRVESRVQLLADGSVEVIYVLSPQRLIEDIQTVGNRLFNDEDLLKMVNVLIATPVDPTLLERSARRIEARYQEKGYYNARVTIDEEELARSGIVVFIIREGERTKVSDVRFTGNLSFSADELSSKVKTHEAWLFSKGPLDNDMLADDTAALIRFYKDRGRLDARADRVVTPSPNAREAVVTFVIDEGPVYTLRSVRVKPGPGDEGVFSSEQLLGLMQIKPGDVYSEDKVRASFDSIKAAFGKLGYADARVGRFEYRDPDSPQVDIEIDVSSGRRFRTGRVEISGNRITRDNVVRRHVTFRPDRPLDATQTDETVRRLRNQQLFAPGADGVRVTIQPEDPDNPDYRDVLVEVKETNTGQLSFGAVVNPDLGLSGRVLFKQRNVDLTDTPDSWSDLFQGSSFRGGGQTFELLLQPGTDFGNYSVSIADPYLLETDYSGSAGLYYRTRDFNDYTENRIGAQVSLGRRFGSRWQATVPLKVEAVELGDIDPAAPTDYFAVQDQRVLTSVGLTLARSTLDSFINPSRGSVISMSVEQFAAPGDETFTQLRAEYKRYFKLDEDFMGRRSTLLVSTSAAYIPQDFDSVPFYERFYLGGRNMRGFAVRAVAPRGVRNDNGEESDETVGGNFQFFFGAEVQRPLYEDLLAGVLFIDTGTVNPDVSFDDYRVAVGFGFRLNVQALSPIPMALDFGFPIVERRGDRHRLFTLSLDLPF